MRVFTPRHEPDQPDQDAHHNLNVWGSAGIIALAVAVAIAATMWRRPSIDALRVAAMAERRLAALAAGPRQADAKTINPEDVR